MNLFEELREMINAAEADASSFYHKNNKAAGTRLRKAMQAIKQTAQAIRVDVQDRKNAE